MFDPVPDFRADPDARDADGWKAAVDRMSQRNVVFIATPDAIHHEMILRALNADQHVICVKPLVQRHDQAVEVERLAREKGSFVGVEYHKRFDRRALVARHDYREGRFGEFRMGEARMVEPWYYRNSNFQNWFTCENYDAFTYVGCHYVDQVYFITGLRPVNVSVIGIKGAFPNGNEGFLWATGRVVFENGGVLNVIDGLGYPDDGAGTNDQGITLYCDDGNRGAIIKHNDQARGVEHGYVDSGGGDALFRYVNPDYFKLVPWSGEGLKPVGYGYESVEGLIDAALQVNEAGDNLDDRRKGIQKINAVGILATPANSAINELVTEAARHSILNDGVAVDIEYDPEPRVIIP
jgi:predicted dehydrogenase